MEPLPAPLRGRLPDASAAKERMQGERHLMSGR